MATEAISAESSTKGTGIPGDLYTRADRFFTELKLAVFTEARRRAAVRRVGNSLCIVDEHDVLDAVRSLFPAAVRTLERSLCDDGLGKSKARRAS